MSKKTFIANNPNLMAEWHFEKNAELNLNPEKLTLGSGKNAWWECPQGHLYYARIGHRSNGHGCPKCSGRKAIKGENDLQTIIPELAQEWNFERNGELTPSDVLPKSGKIVWWKCAKNHEWKTRIASRTKGGTGCPICKSERHTSFPEYAIIYYFQKCGLEVLHSYKGYGYELDIYLPSKKIAIEYDGNFWHKNKEQKDLEKNKRCENDGIQLYRIRESLPSLNSTSIDYLIQNQMQDLPRVIQEILQNITTNTIDIDLKRDFTEIENLRIYTEKEKSLLQSNPDLAKEWDYEKNGSLSPANFAVSSGKRVWWICKKGHPSWQATIANRKQNRGCPVCAGQKVLAGYNDFATHCPHLLDEWDYEKNGDLAPEEVTAKSGKIVFWICKQERHSWKASVGDRCHGSQCPICSHQQILTGYNDFATLHPELLEEWDYEKNGGLDPNRIASHSKQKIWWICKQGHPSWQATLSNRVNTRNCPYCAHIKVWEGHNDLATERPDLAEEWDYVKNGNLKPFQVFPNSNKKVWWRCKYGHPSWQATIASRNIGMGCPYCSNHKVLKGFNDLATKNPLLAEEWDYSLNGTLNPTDVTENSGKKAWWRCKYGHPSWQATIASRNNGSGCPYCSGRYPIKGLTDLATKNPLLAEEWDYTLNGNLKPTDVTENSNKKVWWLCRQGHPSWPTKITHRSNGSGCPLCAVARRVKNRKK